MMKKAIDVAKYILKFCKDSDIKDCSNKKLQKLLYYVQAWSLAFRNKKIFSDDLEAWLHGPVVSSIYHEFKEFGFSPISINLDNFNENIFNKDEKTLMDSVLRNYAEYDAEYLEMRTHIESPWKEARKNTVETIGDDSMKKYYQDVIRKNEAK